MGLMEAWSERDWEQGCGKAPGWLGVDRKGYHTGQCLIEVRNVTFGNR